MKEDSLVGYMCNCSQSTDVQLCIHYNNSNYRLRFFLKHSENLVNIAQHDDTRIIIDNTESGFTCLVANFQVVSELNKDHTDSAFVAVIPNGSTIYCSAGGQDACSTSFLETEVPPNYFVAGKGWMFHNM